MPGLETFLARMRAGGLDGLRAGHIGRDLRIDAGFGPQRLVYADYTASGRALAQVEDFIRDHVLPVYANSHTEASWCGAAMTRLREAARATILQLTGADADCSAVFTGAGATAGINMLVSVLGIRETLNAGGRVVILSGPYEHHSNILPWRETGAEFVAVPEHPEMGGPDMAALQDALREAQGAELIIGAFSACSNVTGILTDVDAVTRALKRQGALAIWDYAGGGPYLPLDMTPTADCAKDAIILSPHKFAGGPGASGVTVLRNTVVRNTRPHRPGGGTVEFVSPWGHHYSRSVTAREEGGTPNVLGDIRAALALLVKEAMGPSQILAHALALRARADRAWQDVPGLHLLGQRAGARALPILSFQVTTPAGMRVHHQLFARMLSDVYGIQVRGGCACAGPYGHNLLEITPQQSRHLAARIAAGFELEKPGWVRLNLGFMHDEGEVAHILAAVPDLIAHADTLVARYTVDPATARFRLRDPATVRFGALAP